MASLLVVDDESSVRMALSMVLEDAGHHVTCAASFHEAVRTLREKGFDLLLVDKNLPDGSGLDLVRRLRADNADVPVVLMTAYGSVESAREALEIGVDRYLAKPFPDIFEVPRVATALLARPRLRWLPNPGAIGVVESSGPAATSVAGLHVVITSADAQRAARMVEPFRAAGAKASVAASVEEVRGTEPDLLVVDLPDPPDRTLLERLRSRFPDARIAVVLGGSPTLQELEEVIAFGVTSLPEALDAGHDRRALAMLQSIALR